MHAQTPPPTVDSALRGTLENIQSNLLTWPWRQPALGDHERIGVLLPEVPPAKRTATIQTRGIRTPPLPSALSRAPPQPSSLYKCVQLFPWLLPKSEEVPGPDKANSAEESPSPSEIFVCLLIRRGHKKGRGILSGRDSWVSTPKNAGRFKQIRPPARIQAGSPSHQLFRC